jgi:hypothetical protein
LKFPCLIGFLLFAAVIETAAAGAPENVPAAPSPPAMSMLRAKGFRLSYFSSTTGEAICRVRAAKILPARKRAGPFLMPAPGYELRQPEIDIIPGVCAAGDWDSLAGYLAGLRYFTLREAITLRLEEPPSVGNTAAGETETINTAARPPLAAWRVTGAPVLRAPPAAPPGVGALLFSALDDAGHRVQLRLFRDAESGALTLRTLPLPPAPPGPVSRAAQSRRPARPAPPPFVLRQP